jgi:imidazole glycerol-phosphate synthase subunit HisF
MLCTRVIPVILIDGFSVVKTQQFSTRRNLGNPIQVVRTYNTRNVDELIILDIDARAQGRSIDVWTLKDITEDCFMPLTIGGGIGSLEDMRATLDAGADKIAINTQALLQPNLIAEGAAHFGRQCIVVSIDYCWHQGEAWVVNPALPAHSLRLLDWAAHAQALGAGELLVTSVMQEGTMQGPDVAVLQLLKSCIRIPVIYNGGLGCAQQAAQVIQAGAHAVAAASLFHFSSVTPEDCKTAMAQAGICVRQLGNG